MDAYSLQELQADLSASTITDDPDTNLELAANIGKLLLERNEELQFTLQEYMEKVEDQQQEIWNLTRKTKALHEVNDSRIKIYEQLEINIEELERTNHALLVQNFNEQELVKNLKESIRALEQRCAELQEHIVFLNEELVKHKARAAEEEASSVEAVELEEESEDEESADDVVAAVTCCSHSERDELKARIRDLNDELDACQVKLGEDEVKMQFLEQQLNTLMLRNNDLEDQINETESVERDYPENAEKDNPRDTHTSLFDEIEEDDSIFEELGCYPQAESSPKPKAALLRDLIEKYEAVLELHKNKNTDDDNKSVDSGIKSASPTFSSSGASGSSSPSDLNSYITTSGSTSPSDFTSSSDLRLSRSASVSTSDLISSRSAATSPTFIFNHKTTQTEPDFIYEVDDVTVEIYKNGKKLRTKLCNKHKCKRLFREFLATLEECSSDEDSDVRDDVRTVVPPAADRPSRVSPPPQCPVVTEQAPVELTTKECVEEKETPAPNSEPVLIPYIRETLEEFITNRKKPTKKKRANCSNQDKPILVGFNNTAASAAKIEIPIGFHFEQLGRYRRSPASKNLSMLKKMETSYSALLKKTETKSEFKTKIFHRS